LEQLNQVFLEAIQIVPELLLQKKKNARQLIKDHYTWDKVAELNLEVIRQILKKNPEIN